MATNPAVPEDTRTALVTGGDVGHRTCDRRKAGRRRADRRACRSRWARGEAARQEIATTTGNDRISVVLGDLADMASVRQAALAIERAHPKLDILVNCAGVYTPKRTVTVDGFETMFATNLLGPFLLTNLVRPQLRAAGSARVLVISAPSGTKLDFDDLQGERRFRSLTNFGASKAADLLFTFELARRLDGTGVTANAIHPGLVRTSLMSGAPAAHPVGGLALLAQSRGRREDHRPARPGPRLRGSFGAVLPSRKGDRPAEVHARSRCRTTTLGRLRRAHGV